jgi:hypothetical protein
MSGKETYLRSLDDPASILECYETHGAVGVVDVLSPDEVKKTVDEIEGLIQELVGPAFSFDDPASYAHASPALNNYGVLGKLPILTDQLNANRFNPKVMQAYSIVYGLPCEQLLPQFDRIAWMRPTKGPRGESWGHFDTPFRSPGIHLDVDPHSYCDPELYPSVQAYLGSLDYESLDCLTKENNARSYLMGRQVQGVLNLFPNEEEDGGFHFSPMAPCPLGRVGLPPALKGWYDRRKVHLPAPQANGRYIFDPSDYEFLWTERIPCPPGTLLLFDAALPHGTKPNRSSKNRMIQFLRYMPKSNLDPKTLKKRSKFLKKHGVLL